MFLPVRSPHFFPPSRAGGDPRHPWLSKHQRPRPARGPSGRPARCNRPAVSDELGLRKIASPEDEADIQDLVPADRGPLVGFQQLEGNWAGHPRRAGGLQGEGSPRLRGDQDQTATQGAREFEDALAPSCLAPQVSHGRLDLAT